MLKCAAPAARRDFGFEPVCVETMGACGDMWARGKPRPRRALADGDTCRDPKPRTRPLHRERTRPQSKAERKSHASAIGACDASPWFERGVRLSG